MHIWWLHVMKVSARNSEVLHAGLYYPEDSLKTKLCILVLAPPSLSLASSRHLTVACAWCANQSQGKLMLTEACKQYSLPWKNTGAFGWLGALAHHTRSPRLEGL
jgi:hypothetical protein